MDGDVSGVISRNADVEKLKRLTLEYLEFQCARLSLIFSLLDVDLDVDLDLQLHQYLHHDREIVQSAEHRMALCISGRECYCDDIRYKLIREFRDDMIFGYGSMVARSSSVEQIEEEWRDLGYDDRFNTGSMHYVLECKRRILEVDRLLNVYGV